MPGEAGALPALPAPLVGRRSPPSATSGHGHAPGAATRDGVSTPAVGLPGLWGGDPGEAAQGCPHGWLRATGAGHHRAVYGGVSLVEAYHPGSPGGFVW